MSGSWPHDVTRAGATSMICNTEEISVNQPHMLSLEIKTRLLPLDT